MSTSKYYTPKVEIKDFNVLIDGKIFFEVPIKNREETYEKVIEISKNNEQAIDLSKQVIDLNLVDINKIVVSDKFEHSDEGLKYFIAYKDDNIIRPLCIILPQKSGYIKYFENGGKNISFMIEDDSVLVKYNEIWSKIKKTFYKFNRLFVLSSENEDVRMSTSKYYTPNVEIKDFNVLIDGKILFDVPIKNKEETYEKVIEMSKNNDYKTGNLLDY